jgi:hypothetical protein
MSYVCDNNNNNNNNNNKRVGGPQGQSGRHGGEKILDLTGTGNPTTMPPSL